MPKDPKPELPIIQHAYDFILYAIPILNRWPRDHKHLLGDRIAEGLYNFLEAPAAEETGLQTFNFGSAPIRTVLRDGEPWWIAADVCAVLEISNATQAVGRLDEDERSMFNIGRQGIANIINESGLFSLVLGSRKPKAFKMWVTSEVPTARCQSNMNRTRCEHGER